MFTGPTGKPIDPRDVSKRIHKLLAPIGLPKLRAHDLRHGYITLAIRQGVPILSVAKLVGHASAKMTLDRYGHVAPNDLRADAGRLDGLSRAAS